MQKLIHHRACYGSHDISKATVKASYQEGSRTREWLESLTDDQWRITSFTPTTRNVCAEVVSTSGVVTTLALVLPNPVVRTVT